MKKPGQTPDSPRFEVPPGSALFHKRERVRLILMAAAMIVLLAVFGSYLFKRGKPTVSEEAPAERTEEELTSVTVVPEIDADALEALVDDATPEGRVTLEGDALESAILMTRILRNAHFEALGIRDLDGDLCAEILADPGAFRGLALRLRGWVDEVRWREGVGERPGHFLCRLRLELGGTAWCVVLQGPEDDVPQPDYFVRVDGIFLKAFSDEGSDGWIDGPLIVGPAAEYSFESIPAVTELSAETFRYVRDDDVREITGMPQDERWELLSYVRHLDPEAIDWGAAPLLTKEQMQAFFAGGESPRGHPFRLPPSEVMDAWNVDPGENPARLETISRGWIGNYGWDQPAVVLQYEMPFEKGEIARKSAVTGRGFFFKNLAYEAKNGQLAVAPFFVMHSLEEIVPVEDPTFLYLTYVAAGSLLLFAFLIAWLLVRDRRKSKDLQAELLRRRRARRQQLAQEEAEGA